MNNNFNREGDCAKRGHVHCVECLPVWAGSPLDVVIGKTAIAICCGVSEASVQYQLVRRQALPAFRVKYTVRRQLVAMRRDELPALTALLGMRVRQAPHQVNPPVSIAPPAPVRRDPLLSALMRAHGGVQ